MFKLISRAAVLLVLAAPAPLAAPASLPAGPALDPPRPQPILVPLSCAGSAALGCVLGVPGQAWTLDPAAGRRMLSETFLLELEGREPAVWRRFSFSLPLDEDRARVRASAGDRVFLNLPSRPHDDQFFDCEPVLPLRPGTALAECRSLSFVDQILPECLCREGAGGATGLRCLAGPPMRLGRGVPV